MRYKVFQNIEAKYILLAKSLNIVVLNSRHFVIFSFGNFEWKQLQQRRHYNHYYIFQLE